MVGRAESREWQEECEGLGGKESMAGGRQRERSERSEWASGGVLQELAHARRSL